MVLEHNEQTCSNGDICQRQKQRGAKVDGARRKPPVFNYQVKCLGWFSDEYFKLDIAARPSTAGHWLRGVKLTCLIIKIFC